MYQRPHFKMTRLHESKRDGTTTKITRRRKPEVKRGTSETQGCRRSGAAPCCAAVGNFPLRLFL